MHELPQSAKPRPTRRVGQTELVLRRLRRTLLATEIRSSPAIAPLQRSGANTAGRQLRFDGKWSRLAAGQVKRLGCLGGLDDRLLVVARRPMCCDQSMEKWGINRPSRWDFVGVGLQLRREWL